MSRLMSVALTQQAVIGRVKTVTRRTRWLRTQPGDRITLCPKVQGLKPGEKVVRLAEVEVVSVRRERLDAITSEDIALEGFQGMTKEEFVKFFCRHMGCRPDTIVTRIEWRYLP